MTTINELRKAIDKVHAAGEVANRLWDAAFIDVMTITADKRYVYSVTLHSGATSTIKFERMNRETGRTDQSRMEALTFSQARKVREKLENNFWPETA